MAGIQTRLKQFYSDFQYIYSKLKVCSSLKGKKALKSLKISIILCSRLCYPFRFKVMILIVREFHSEIGPI